MRERRGGRLTGYQPKGGGRGGGGGADDGLEREEEGGRRNEVVKDDSRGKDRKKVDQFGLFYFSIKTNTTEPEAKKQTALMSR